MINIKPLSKEHQAFISAYAVIRERKENETFCPTMIIEEDGSAMFHWRCSDYKVNSPTEFEHFLLLARKLAQKDELKSRKKVKS